MTLEELKAMLKEQEERLGKTVPEIVKEVIKPLQVAIDNKVVNAISPADQVKREAKERTIAMVRAIYNRQFAEAEKLSDNATQKFTGQGYLIPQEFAATIFTLLDVYGVARKFCYTYPMGTETAQLPKLLTGLTMTWIGSVAHAAAGWKSGKRKPVTEPEIGKVDLKIKDIAGVVPLETKLIKDTNSNLEALLPMLIAHALAVAEDSALFNGVAYPAGEIVGGLLAAATALVGTGTGFGDCTIADLLDMQGQISSAALMGARYFAHPSVKSHFRKKGLEAGWAGRITMEDALGYPFEVSNGLPAMSASAVDTPFVLFGNLQNVYLGDRQQLAVDTATEANIYDKDGNLLHALFQDNMIGLRALAREDIKSMEDAAFCALKTKAS